MMSSDYAVLGGGLVGMAMAYGLLRLGHTVTVLDEGDVAFRASRGNFGLVWVQGKGAALPAYARWTRRSAALWPGFARELTECTGVDVEHAQPGGFDFHLDEAEAEAAVARLSGLREALDGDYPFEALGHNALKQRIPEIGPDVVGATFCPEDGHANPLYLLRALHAAVRALGGRVVAGAPVSRIDSLEPGFRVHGAQTVEAGRVVLCAGLGNATLAPMVGLSAPVRPQRGQVIVCERVRPFLHHPSMRIRQVAEGAVQLGDSQEEVGLDDGTTPPVLLAIVRRAVRTFPLLRQVRMVRAWGALRVMSPDGHPVYDASTQCPGAYLVTCHSGVTLAAAHALELARWVARGESPQPMEEFSAARFGVQTD